MPSQICGGKFRCEKFRGSPWILCGKFRGTLPEMLWCVGLCRPRWSLATGANFAEDPRFRVGNFAANLKRKISHTKLTAPQIPSPPVSQRKTEVGLECPTIIPSVFASLVRRARQHARHRTHHRAFHTLAQKLQKPPCIPHTPHHTTQTVHTLLRTTTTPPHVPHNARGSTRGRFRQPHHEPAVLRSTYFESTPRHNRWGNARVRSAKNWADIRRPRVRTEKDGRVEWTASGLVRVRRLLVEAVCTDRAADVLPTHASGAHDLSPKGIGETEDRHSSGCSWGRGRGAEGF